MKNLFIFLAGAATGSIITWKLIEKKYKNLADEEIESVKKVFKEKQEKINNIGNSKNNFETYKDIIKDLNNNEKDEYNEIANSYSNEETTEDDKVEEKEISNNSADHSKPYIISPEEYGELYGYDTKSWTYYADDILVDEYDQIVEDPELYIGDALKHFGEYEEDSIHVRDEVSATDYEILRVTEEFSKIL